MANAPRSDVLSGFEKEQVLATVRDVLDDTDVQVEITLKSLTSQSVDLETGAVTRTSDADTVNALRRVVMAPEVTANGTQLEPEDRVYLIDQADLTNTQLQTVDRIVEGTLVLGVIDFAADPFDMVWQIVARAV